MKADKLILGNIVTLDPRNPILKALTVKDGLVQYVGTIEMAKKLCDEKTIVIDYKDNYVYPGFIESHCHGGIAGPRIAFFADLSSGNSISEYLELLKKFIDEHPTNSFYYGAGWRETDTPPTAKMLDDICSDKPIALNSIDGHSIWFNTLGMEKFGINQDMVKTWGRDIIRVDEDGNPTGYISEGPVTEISIKMNLFAKEDYKYSLLKWQEFALSLGFTSYYEAGINEHLLKTYTELINEGKWKIRVYAGYMIDEREEDYVAKVREAKLMADKYNCEYLRITGVKIFMDGVVEAHTAWTLEEYSDRPGYTGVKRFCDRERVVELYKEAARLGLNVHQHTIGDGAVHFALDCMEEAQVATGNMAMRNALAHVQMITPEDIERLCALNAIAVVAPLWMTRDEIGIYDQSLRYIGPKRTFYSYPIKSFLDKSGIVAFHSDFPVSSAVSVPRSIYMACKRKEPGGGAFNQWNPDECISRDEAIAGLTIGPAYSVMQENHMGSLRIGYVANMAVFDKNFLYDDIEEVAKAKCLATIIDGEEVYSLK